MLGLGPDRALRRFVNQAGYASPIRTPRGRDIFAACGQLKSESERMKRGDRLALEAAVAGYTPPGRLGAPPVIQVLRFLS